MNLLLTANAAPWLSVCVCVCWSALDVSLCSLNEPQIIHVLLGIPLLTSDLIGWWTICRLNYRAADPALMFS